MKAESVKIQDVFSNSRRTQCGGSGDYLGRRWQIGVEKLIEARSHKVLSVPKSLECI